MCLIPGRSLCIAIDIFKFLSSFFNLRFHPAFHPALEVLLQHSVYYGTTYHNKSLLLLVRRLLILWATYVSFVYRFSYSLRQCMSTMYRFTVRFSGLYILFIIITDRSMHFSYKLTLERNKETSECSTR